MRGWNSGNPDARSTYPMPRVGGSGYLRGMTDTRGLVASFIETLERRDWDAWVALLHPEVVDELPQSRERIRGRDCYLQFNRSAPATGISASRWRSVMPPTGWPGSAGGWGMSRQRGWRSSISTMTG